MTDDTTDQLTTDLRGLDLAAFHRWYDGERPGDLDPDLRGRFLAGGKSNLTYEVTDGTTTRVVRRPPLGHVQATAHDMGREHTVMSALAGTAVPVPQTYAMCRDTDVLGAEFYVMELVRGTPYRTADQLAQIGPEATGRLAGAMVDVLAALHQVDPAAVGLEELGRPQGFLERQVRRWARQLEGSSSRELPDADTLVTRLRENVPAGDAEAVRAGIVHGDYRLDNLLADPDRVGQEVLAVVDWEMATLGDPLTDVALLLVYDRLSSITGGAAVADASRAPGYPGPDAILERYAAGGGLALDTLDFHLGLAYFKLAAILEGIHFRHQQGQTVGAGFDGVGEAVPTLLAAGLDATRSLA
ncbi:Putative aminoglycoside phosphotransferase [Nocardioides aquaticus]|uniref:Aminoglycoside phosphotransferase n=1 Tax=Nocardioides aquaticus TaxID=160826 RepID=A0ABX8EI10_9ACTN|nr:phosphotransferase family protein [Nocardioides aquaticus]QVT78707.1 Putative aminoglycoside phosphotransferase [Nocardioides aquaticus]